MADQKISELTNILGSDVGAGDEFVVVDSSANETKAITTLELRTAIGNGDFTVTGDLTVQGTTITVDSATAQNIVLGDNDKMTFGAGSDLQIYHDGLHSYIKDTGTGRLHFTSNSYVFYNAAGTERGLDILENDEVRLYFDGSEKLATTSTGIDVTGTVTADGLTVNGGYLTVDNGYGITTVGGLKYIADSDNNAPSTGLIHQFLTDSSSLALGIQKNGNVGIGTSSPSSYNSGSNNLVVGGSSGDNGITIATGTTNGGLLAFADGTTGNAAYRGYIQYDHNTDFLAVGSAGTERMRIDSSGNVGIGESNPDGRIDISVSGANERIHTVRPAGGSGSPQFGFKFRWGDDGDSPEIGLTHGGSYANAGLYFDTMSGGSKVSAMRIDSSGNVGIGTSSPASYGLSVEKSASTAIGMNIRNVNTGSSVYAGIYFGGATSETDVFLGAVGDNTTTYGGGRSAVFGTNASTPTVLITGGTERMRIDSSGNLLVGRTSSLFSNASVEFADTNTSTSISSGAGSAISIQNLSTADNTYSTIYFTNGGGGIDSAIYGLHEVGNGTGTGRTGSLAFATANLGGGASERMRIDSSGNLLVGTTSTTPAVSNDSNGTALQANGTVQFSANATTTAIINRKSTDGPILQFRKDGTTVGSIGSQGGDSLTVGNGDTGLLFTGANDAIHPWNTSTNASRDGAIDLGRSSQRFKDLYLSGGVYLGGTGSANKLDDYEEGTFTPVLARWSGGAISATYVTQRGVYTKIGNQVTVGFYIEISAISSQGTSLNYIGGLPFNFADADDNYMFVGGFGNRTTLASSVNATSLTRHYTNASLLIRGNDDYSLNIATDWQTGTISGSATYLIT